jgi:hypothetical protein
MSRAFHWQPDVAEEMLVDDLMAYFKAGRAMLKAEGATK